MKQTQNNHNLIELKQILLNLQRYTALAQKMIAQMLGESPGPDILRADAAPEEFKVDKFPTGEEIILGIFDGKAMIGPEDKKYDVPENYSSKSKLVQGDKLKLIITSEGRFIYKQIGPMERQTKKGVILFNDEGEQYYVSADGVEYKVLRASITYYKGEIGDTAVILVPQGQLSAWAAVDHIIKDSSISEPTSIESKENNVEDVEKIEKIDEVEKEEAVNGGLEEI